MKVLGITGGIGCGKSDILNYLRNKHSVFVCETDLIAKELQKPGNICYEQIINNFGTDILNSDKTISKEKLAEIIFCNSQKLAKINDIVHKEVIKEVFHLLKIKNEENIKIFVIESALLYESRLCKFCSEIWYIYTDKKIRKKRLIKSRNYSEKKIENIMKQQLSHNKFMKICDVVIENNHSKIFTYLQVENNLEKFLNSQQKTPIFFI